MMNDPMMPEQDPSSMALAAAEVTLEMLPMLPDTALQALAGAASQELQGRMGGDPMMGAPMPMDAPMPPPQAADPMMQGIGAMAV